MRVLLSAIALAALLLLAGAVSVFAADGALVADAPVTVEPLQPPLDPGTTGSATDTVTEAAAPAGELLADTADPVVDVAEPVVAPIVEVVDPVLDPVLDTIAPVVAPIVDIVDPVLDPIIDVIDPIAGPIIDVVDPIVDVVDPIVDPGVDVVEPVTPPVLDVGDPSAPHGAIGPAIDPADGLSLGAGAAAATAARTSIVYLGWRPVGSDPTAANPRVGIAAADPPSMSAPAGVPYPIVPLLPLSGSAGSGSSLTLAAWIALLTAGMLALVFHAFRRPWSPVPILRGRSLLPALRPA